MKQLHCQCRNFSKASYGTGSCRVNDSPVKPKEEACKDFKEGQHPVMKRAAMFMGVVGQKSLLEVITDRSLPK